MKIELIILLAFTVLVNSSVARKFRKRRMCNCDNLIHFSARKSRKFPRWPLRSMATGRRRPGNLGHAQFFPFGQLRIKLRACFTNWGLQWLPNSVPTRTCIQSNYASGRSVSTWHPLWVFVRVYLSRTTEASWFLEFVPPHQLAAGASIVGHTESG